MDGYLEDYIEKVLIHMWEEPKKMDDPEVIKLLLMNPWILKVDKIKYESECKS